MGDRGNIEIRQPREGNIPIFLYTHWRGSYVNEILADALVKGKEGGRLSDYTYLTRIVFQEMIDGDDGTTGFGISVGSVDDNEHNIPTVYWHTDNGLSINLLGQDYTPQEWIDEFAGKIRPIIQMRVVPS
jgi:hypothetical protein